MNHRIEKRLQYHDRTMRLVCIVVLVAAITMTAQASYGLSPPWWICYRYLSSTVGKTPGVLVHEPDESTITISITVLNEKRREALATVLQDYMLGTTIRIVDGDGTVQQPAVVGGTEEEQVETVRTLVMNAFEYNPYLYRIKTAAFPAQAVFFITRACIIQFFTDDLNDYYGRGTFVVEDVFRECVRQQIADVPIFFSTQKILPSAK